MSTYVIGDIHGCFTQFIELKERIEASDPEAVLILTGDLVARGKEEEKMLEWAYNNITKDGKYQMVLGNHDDDFIAVFGKNEFETIYSIDKRSPPKDEFNHLKDTELMYKYASFLAKQPLIKKVTAGKNNYIITHAWYKPEINSKKNDKNSLFGKRYCLLWERFLDDYTGEIRLRYNPVNNEKLIHGHTPTIFPKDATYRGYSPGKVWDMGNNIDIDCGLVFNVIKRSKYGNLAAYNLETGDIEYLYEIEDDYINREGEYLDDKLEREKKEKEENEKQKIITRQKAEPYLKSFYKQVFKLDKIPSKNINNFICNFNFLGDYIYPSIDTGKEYNKISNFDFENEPLIAMVEDEKDHSNTLYLFNRNSQYWSGVIIKRDMPYHKIYQYKDLYYILSVNHYNNEYLEITIYVFNRYEAKQILYYKTITPNYRSLDAEGIMENNIKLDFKNESNGLITCDFYDERNLFLIKILRNIGGCFLIRVFDSSNNILAEIRKTNY